MIETVGNSVTLAVLLLLGYFLFVKSALVTLWWAPLSPLLHRLGFRCVVMDRSFHIYGIRWRREWVGGVE